MNDLIIFQVRTVLLFLVTLLSPPEYSKANPAGNLVGDPFLIEAPVPYQIVQRGHDDKAWLKVELSSVNKELVGKRLDYRLRIHGHWSGWKRLEGEWINQRFTGRKKVPSGGWHTLEIRVTGNPGNRSQSVMFGVGEIFVVVGQSNSANYGEKKQSTRTELVTAFDYENGKWQLAKDPQPGAGGKGGSIMPILGDVLVEKFKVPVGIVAYGQGGTSVREWLPRGSKFPNPPSRLKRVRQMKDNQWESLGEIYPGFIERMKLLGPNGFRAVIWHQGESDANQKDPSRSLAGPIYEKCLTELIGQSRSDLGWKVPWFVAQVSYHVPGDESDPAIRSAQANLWKKGVALEGPDTDQLKGSLRERNGQGVHFSGEGLHAHAQLWAEKMIPWIEQQIRASQYKFSFGAIADCQYCESPDRGQRKYSASKEKLQKCVKHFNRENLSFVIHLGDFIDRNFSSFDDLLPIYNSLDAPGYHVLGNHDFEVADDYKSQVPEKLGMPSKYYDFKIKNWRFLCLDGNDLSFIAYPRGSKRYQDSETYYREKKIRSPKWNGGVGQKQMSWIREVLQTAEDSQEKVILFSHFPVYPPDPHNLWNAKEVISLLEEFSCVKAYINGHNHKGKYGIKNGIHYLTCKGMVDTNESAYSIANVFEDRIEIIGYGRETKEKFLKIRNNE